MELFGEFHEIFTFGALGEWQPLSLLIQPQATSCLFFQIHRVPTKGENPSRSSLALTAAPSEV